MSKSFKTFKQNRIEEDSEESLKVVPTSVVSVKIDPNKKSNDSNSYRQLTQKELKYLITYELKGSQKKIAEQIYEERFGK